MCRLTRQGNPDADIATANESNPHMSPFQATQKQHSMLYCFNFIFQLKVKFQQHSKLNAEEILKAHYLLETFF